MKRVILAPLAAFAFFASSILPTSAADLPRRTEMPVKAPPPAPFYNWTGFYLGINGGGGWGRSSWDAAAFSTGSFNLSGGVIGGTIGYNWQTGPWVWGLEGDIDWSSLSGSTTAGCPAGCETANSWLGTARGRLGYAFDRWMPYITGGAAFGDIKANPAGLAGASDTNVGWTIGAGLEFALAGNWTAKAEYLYVDLGSINCPAPACSVTGLSPDVDFHTHLIRGGLNYRF